jgi:hypothetical protein
MKPGRSLNYARSSREDAVVATIRAIAATRRARMVLTSVGPGW